MPLWSVLTPVAACVLLGIALHGVAGALWVAVLGATLIASVLTAVHHAEVVAHRTGEPFGTLILPIAVTVIEVALIVSLMLAGGDDKALLARDAVFPAIRNVLNGRVRLRQLPG